MIISGLFLAGASVTFIASSWLTIASHTYILHSLSGVLIIIYKVCTNQQVHFLEKIGSLAVMAGTVLLLCDPNVHKADGQETSIVGEFLALLCAGFFALYFTSSKRVQTKIPGLIILLLNSLISIACCILVMITVYGVDAHKILSFDPYEGIFGLFSTQQTGVSLILLPVSLNVAGYTLALNYFQPHIVGNAFVVEPFIGQLIGCLAHQDQLPGVLTFTVFKYNRKLIYLLLALSLLTTWP